MAGPTTAPRGTALPTEPIRHNFASKVVRLRSREAGRATTIVVAILALAAVGGLAFTLIEMATPPIIGQEKERETASSPHAVADKGGDKGGEQNQRSALPGPGSRQTASELTAPSEPRALGARRSNVRPAPSGVSYEEPSGPDPRPRPRPRPRPKDGGAPTDRRTAVHRAREESQPGGRDPHDTFASESSPEEVSEPSPGIDLFDKDFLWDAADNWGYEELPPRIAIQAGLEEGFLVVRFEGEFVHGPEALQSKASRPDQPDLVAIGVWNPWTGEQATVMLPLDSLTFSELPE